MDASQTIVSRTELYNSLDAFTESRRAEIDKRSLKKGTGLLKSYIVETTQHNGTPDIVQSLRGDSLFVDRQDAEVIQLNYADGIFGYAEPLTSRHFAIHSYVQNDTADRTIT